MATSARRRRWVWLGVLPALLLLALFGARALLEPERLSAFLLRQASQATGLQLALSQPADVGFWPDLHLELAGLTATASGAASPLLRVERVDAVLPWSALHSDALEIRSLRLVKPRLDWPSLQAWLATRRSDAPPTLPRIDAAVEVSDGEIAGDGWRIYGLSLRLPSLRAGTPTSLALAGLFGTTPFDLKIDATPRQAPGGLRLDALTIVAKAPIEVTLRCSLDATDTLTLTLAGELPSWPAQWPALPLPAEDAAAPVRLAFDYAGSALKASIARGDEIIDVDIALGDLGAWLDETPATTLPPLTGTVRAARLQSGGIELRGVELRIEDDDASP